MAAEASVTFLLENVVGLLKYQVNLIAGAKSELELLKTDLTSLKAFLRDAAAVPNKLEGFRDLENRIRDVVYDVEDTIDSCMTQAAIAKQKGSFRGLFSSKRASLAEEVKSLREKKVIQMVATAKSFAASATGRGSKTSNEDSISKLPKNVGFWNVRGLHDSRKQREVSSFILNNGIDVFGLLETKLNSSSYEGFKKGSLREWSFFDNFSLARNGRILLVWNPSRVLLDVCFVDAQVLLAKVECRVSGNRFHLALCYGRNQLQERRDMWDALIERCPLDEPLLVGGDFNNVLDFDERVGGRTPIEREVRGFVDTVAYLNLQDCPSTGCFFTWNNTTVFSRIDRFFLNNAWLEMGWSAKAHFHTRGTGFDHSACTVELFKPIKRFRRDFKFCNFWNSEPKFKEVLERSWNVHCGTLVGQQRLSFKLRRLRSDLKPLKQKEFANISVRANEARSALKAIQERVDKEPLNDSLRLEEAQIRKNCKFLENAEHSFLAQRAKSNKLNLFDKNSKYFHSIIKSTSARNTISFIRRADDSITGDMNTIIGDFSQFYQNLFGRATQRVKVDGEIFTEGAVLSGEDQAGLVHKITETEIKEAIFGIGDEKSPGPDGFPAGFYKKNWEIVGRDVIEGVLEFFEKGVILREWNHTAVTLIPKKSHEPTVADFRPIACTNVVYKAITKILNNRLAPLLPKVVSPAQSAFIKGRNLTDNYLLAQALVHRYGMKQLAPKCLVKIDLQKAYDSISWDFLLEVLWGLKLHPCFIHWVMTCVTSPTFTLSINGGAHGFIKGRRGLRQGDPMSPTLFLLCMEYLSRLLKRRTSEADFSFHAKCEAEGITHLAFADDLLLFGRGDFPSMAVLADCISEFSSTSGLAVNAGKSAIFFSNVPGFTKDLILDKFGFPEGQLPTKYLGLPLTSRSLLISQFSPLIESIAGRINRWNNSYLSLAGRAELVRSVIQGIECFWIQCLPLPGGVSDRIHTLLRRFVWGGKSCPVAWKTACLPKAEGGLGFRFLPSWNKALLSKIIWNIQAKADSLWIRWLHSEILNHRDFWTTRREGKDPALLSSLFRIRDDILERVGRDPTKGRELVDGWFKGGGVSEAYDFFRPSAPTQYWHRAIWHSYIPPRFTITMWFALHGRLKTVDRMKFMEQPLVCGLCNRENESHDHLFFACCKTRQLWCMVKRWLRITGTVNTILSAIRFCKHNKAGSGVLRKARWIAMAATVNHVWYARNKFKHRQSPFDATRIFHDIKVDVFHVLYNAFPVDTVLSHMEVNTSE